MKKLLFITVLFVGLSTAFSQVGIGTTNPNPDALLDVDATTNKGGLLMPRLELLSTTDAYPLQNHVPGMTLYNTATTSGLEGVRPGYYYNNGTKWMRLATEENSSNSWTTLGNSETDPDVNFLGTSDGKALRIRTNDVERFEISANGNLRSFSPGTETAPIYSWQSNQGTGIFKPGANNIGFTTDEVERFRISFRNQVWAMDAGTAALPFFSWESNPGTGIYKPGANNIGFTTDGVERFRISFKNQVWAMDAGTASLPFFSWESHPSTGIYKPGANNIGFTTDGVERFRISFKNQVWAMDAGTASQPFYSWEANQSTGIFNPAVNNIGFSTNGIERFRIPFGNMVWAMGPGSAAFPFYSWESHRGTGIYKPGGDNLGFSTAGNTRMIVNDNGNVGINTSSPTQKLHLAGNMRLQGAFMPNNNPGQVGSILTSNGSNSSPTWGYKIKRFISSPHNISSNSRQLIYFDSPGLNRNATIIANVRGDWPSAPKVSIDYVEVQANRFILAVSNNTGGIFGGGTNYENMDFNIMIIEWN